MKSSLVDWGRVHDLADREQPDVDARNSECGPSRVPGMVDPFTPLKRRMDYTKPYRELIENAKRESFTYPRLDPERAHRLEKALAGDIGLKWELQGKKLNWISGLTAFCDHSKEDVITAITSSHLDLNSAIHEVVRELMDDYDPDRSHDYSQHTDLATKRGAYLASNLYVPDRDYLTPGFVSEILRPYLQVSREALHLLWARIKRAHQGGQMLIFSRDGDGRFELHTPGDGFDRRGTYEIPRKAYLEGFNLGENDVDRSLIKSEPGDFDPRSLRFLGADQVLDYCLEEGSNKQKQRPAGRPNGINFDANDAPLIEEMHRLIQNRQARSIADAAQQVIESDPCRVAGSGTPESKEKRLARGYSKRY